MDKTLLLAFNSFSADLERLSKNGILGFYNRFEITEIVAFDENDFPINVFSIFVAEQGQDTLQSVEARSECLSAERISLPGLPDWKFGLWRYSLSIPEMMTAITTYVETQEWRPSGKGLGVGILRPSQPQFVPPDSFQLTPCNSVLKNNFWNGSYILELFDSTKDKLAYFFDQPKLLADLSGAIAEYLPLGIGGVSDRLGNILIQLPVTVLTAKFVLQGVPPSLGVNLAWHPQATPRPLRAQCEIEFDGLIQVYANTDALKQSISFSLPDINQPHTGRLWDDENRVLLAATRPSAFIRRVGLNVQAVSGGQEPRRFFAPDINGILKENQVMLMVPQEPQMIGEEFDNSIIGWTERRLYAEEVARATAQRKFVQYGLKNIDKVAEHERAISDLRALIAEHGKYGTWLWDPFLSADDILNTLFFNPYYGVEIKALSAGESIDKVTKSDWADNQKERLEIAKGNLLGLQFEYRLKIGQEGWNFHDRFLIFPRQGEGAFAWSLGASVNSLGYSHHILQKVADGQMVANAFADLWDALIKSEHLIWKTP